MTRPGVLLFALVAALSGLAHADPRVDIAKAFVTNAHTGQPMRPELWLTKDTRTAEAFVAFGGLDALVRQTTARAERFGGLKSVEVLSVSSDGDTLLVKIEVRFNRVPENVAGAGAASTEPMIWEMRVLREDDRWKLRL